MQKTNFITQLILEVKLISILHNFGHAYSCQTIPVTLRLQKLMWQLFAMKINLWLPKSFESTLTIENGLPDFHKLIVTALKVKHEKVSLKLYSSKTTKSLTRQDFLINFQ